MTGYAKYARRPEPHCVYRAFDSDDVLLYVGCAVDPARRQRQHAQMGWYSQAARWTHEWFPNFWAASNAETAAIKTEGPRFNITHRALILKHKACIVCSTDRVVYWHHPDKCPERDAVAS